MAWTPTESGAYLPITQLFANAKFSNSTDAVDSSATDAADSGIFIPFSDLESYKVGTSGDFREFVYSVLNSAQSGVARINTELAVFDAASGIDNLTFTKTVDASRLGTNNEITNFYNVSTVLNVGNITYDVAEE